MLTHTDIWRAIDRLAQRHGLSASGLARKAGLSPTIFNPSKRSSGKRKRWPSTESIAAVLKATGSSPEEFVALASATAPQHTSLPLLGLTEASHKGRFDDSGLPVREGWDTLTLPGATDSDAFALEVGSRHFEPHYPEGTTLLLSPAEKPRRGDRVAVCTTEGEILIKQLGREGAQKIELMSLSPDQPPLTVPRKDVTWLYRIVWASQ